MTGLLFNALLGLLLISPTLFFVDTDTSQEIDGFADLDLGPSIIASNMDPTMGFFYENQGQFPSDHDFCSSLSFGRISFTSSGVQIAPYKTQAEEGQQTTTEGGPLQYSFPGANIVSPEGEGEPSHPCNFFMGNDPSSWVTGVRSYRSIMYRDLWDHIDLRYILGNSGLKYEFIVHPGGSMDDIEVHLEGGDLSLLPSGDMNVLMSDGTSIQDRDLLVHYQDDPTNTIEADFQVSTPNSYSFDLADHDPSRTVVIDPLFTSTFIGAGSEDFAYDHVVDDNYDVYITGKTRSPLFPTLNNPYDNSYNENWDAYVLKYDPMDSTVLFSTFLGGGDYDSGMGITLSDEGDIFVTGPTYSNYFPVTPGCNRSTPIDDEDMFVSRFSSDGSELLASTYAGGSGRDISYDIVVDETSSPYITGMTESADFPTSMTAMNRTINGGEDIFILKFDENLASIEYSSFLGGSGNDKAFSMEIDDDYLLYLTGSTDSVDFPITVDHYGLGSGSQSNVFIITFHTFLTGAIRSILVGDAGQEEGRDIYIDDDWDIYVTGSTTSDSFPTTPNCYDASRNGLKDGFLVKADRNLSTIRYSSFIGGSKDDTGMGIGMDNAGRVLLAITTESEDMPIVDAIHDDSQNGKRDTYLVAFNENKKSVYRSTYLGGGEDDETIGLSIDGEGNAYVLGNTRSKIYPSIPGAYDDTHNGNSDLFVTVVNLSYPPTEPRNPTFSFGDGYVDMDWYVSEWDGNSPLEGYNVYRRSDDQAEFSLIATVGANHYLDENITNGVIYHYYITSINLIGESIPSDIITISDLEDPQMDLDLTGSVATEGRDFLFNVEISDNVLVSGAFVTYKQDHVAIMELEKGEGNNWSGEIRIRDSLDPLTYNFSCHDPSMNWAHTQEKTVLVRDLTKPDLVEDRTEDTCNTGDPILFEVEAIDNIELAEVWVEYRSSTLPPDEGNISLERCEDDLWTASVPTAHMLTDYSYIFHAADPSGNWNSSEMAGVVTVLDGIDPVIANDTTPDNVEMGSELLFSVEMEDNVKVSVANLFYTIDGGLVQEQNLHFNGVYSATLPPIGIPGAEIEYYFYAEDSSGNWFEAAGRTVKVVDLNPPELVSDGTAVNFTNGAEFEFIVEVEDDDGMDSAFVEYWFGDGAHLNVTMGGDDPYSYTISIGLHRYNDLFYIFHFVDPSGNFNSTPTKIVEAPEKPVEKKEEEKGAWAAVIILIVLALLVVLIVAALLVVLLRRKPTEEEVTEDEAEDSSETEGKEGEIKQEIVVVGTNQQVNYMYGFK